MVEKEKLPEVQRAWPISPFKRYSGVRRRLSQQPCTSRMVVTLVLCLLACAQASAAGEWQSADGYRFKTLTVSTNEPVGFTSLSPGSTGIDFVNRLGKERYTTNQIYLNGAGVAAGDYDGDGMCDLFFVGSILKINFIETWADGGLRTYPQKPVSGGKTSQQPARVSPT